MRWAFASSGVQLSSLISLVYRLSTAALAGVYAEDNGGLCPTQESKLAVLWTIGIFALNFGPVFVGPILDWVGPKITTVLGETDNDTCTVVSCCHSMRLPLIV